MKVKVRGQIYHADKEAVMVYLTPGDIKNIVNMHKDCCVYCEYPDSIPVDEAKEMTQEFRVQVDAYNPMLPIGETIIGKPEAIKPELKLTGL